MKKLLLTPLIILFIIWGFFTYKIFFTDKNIQDKKPDSTPNETVNKNEDEPESKEPEYVDNNPITVGLYKYYGSSKNRELITEYTDSWEYHKDISSFEVYYTNESEINSKWLPTTFDEFKSNYENVDNYRIGYIIEFDTTNGNINKTILSPKDSEEFFQYLEIYLYDDYHRQNGVWYSHTTEEEFNSETLVTSIKLTAGVNVKEITSDIKVTAFTYDEDDFDLEGHYKGNSKYTIIVKKS